MNSQRKQVENLKGRVLTATLRRVPSGFSNHRGRLSGFPVRLMRLETRAVVIHTATQSEAHEVFKKLDDWEVT